VYYKPCTLVVAAGRGHPGWPAFPTYLTVSRQPRIPGEDHLDHRQFIEIPTHRPVSVYLQSSCFSHADNPPTASRFRGDYGCPDWTFSPILGACGSRKPSSSKLPSRYQSPRQVVANEWPPIDPAQPLRRALEDRARQEFINAQMMPASPDRDTQAEITRLQEELGL